VERMKGGACNRGISGSRKSLGRGSIIRDLLFVFSILITMECLMFSPASAEDDIVKFVQKKQIELKEKEESLKKEESRLSVVKKDLDERIAKYENLLTQLDEKLKRLEQKRKEELEHVIKIYEAMPPEEAASRLSAADEDMAVQIMRSMKSKKAGPIMALMEPRKAALITRELSMHKERGNTPVQ
jgi:flagellar motility protein MotE (MotC chaperone)